MPSDRRGIVQQLHAESLEIIRSVNALHRRNMWLAFFDLRGKRPSEREIRDRLCEETARKLKTSLCSMF